MRQDRAWAKQAMQKIAADFNRSADTHLIRLDILGLLLRLKEEEHLALLYITHDIAGARYFSDETFVLYAGQMVEGGPSEEITQRPKHPYTQLLLSAAPDPDRMGAEGNGLRALPQRRGEIPSLITPPSGCRFHPRCPHAMEVCRQRFPKRTDLGGGHWTNCFLYGDGGTPYERVPLADAAAPVAPAQTHVDGNGSLGKSKENV